MKLFLYASFVAAFILGFAWSGHTTYAGTNGDPKKEIKKQECPWLAGEKTSKCPYTGKEGASNKTKKDSKNSECPYTGKKGECPYSGDKAECPVTGEKGKVSTGSETTPVKKIEVKKV